MSSGVKWVQILNFFSPIKTLEGVDEMSESGFQVQPGSNLRYIFGAGCSAGCEIQHVIAAPFLVCSTSFSELG